MCVKCVSSVCPVCVQFVSSVCVCMAEIVLCERVTANVCVCDPEIACVCMNPPHGRTHTRHSTASRLCITRVCALCVCEYTCGGGGGGGGGG